MDDNPDRGAGDVRKDLQAAGGPHRGRSVRVADAPRRGRPPRAAAHRGLHAAEAARRKGRRHEAVAARHTGHLPRSWAVAASGRSRGKALSIRRHAIGIALLARQDPARPAVPQVVELLTPCLRWPRAAAPGFQELLGRRSCQMSTLPRLLWKGLRLRA